MNRAIAVLLTAVLLFGCVPGWAEESAGEKDPAALLPTLFITAEYDDRTKQGEITGKFTLECRYPEDPEGKATGAPDTVITFEGKEGLTFADGTPEKIEAGSIPCGGVYTFTLRLKYDETLVEDKEEKEEINPILQISANSPTIGGCVYTCIFDITPKPRALLMGVNTSPYLLDAYLMQDTIDALSAEFDRFYYDKQPISVSTSIMDVSDPGCAGFWDSMQTLKAFKPDENDVTYLYINAFTEGANGVPISGILATEGGEKITVSYDEIFAWLSENIKGRVIVMADGKFAGKAVRSFSSSGLDAEYCNVFCVNTPTAPSVAGGQGTPYQGMMARSIAEAAEPVYSASTFSALLSKANLPTNKFLMDTTGAPMSAYYAGASGNLLFATDPKYDSGVRILDVKEEKCVVMPLDPLMLYYQYLREIAVPEEGLATPGTITGPVSSHIDTSEDHWAGLAAQGGQGFVSAAVNDFDKNGTQDMIAVYAQAQHLPFSERAHIPSRYDKTISRISDMNFCWYLRLYQIEEGKVVLADSIRAAYVETHMSWPSGEAHIYIKESEGRVYIHGGGGFIGTDSEDGANGFMVTIHEGKIVPIEQIDPDFNSIQHGAFAYYYEEPILTPDGRHADILTEYTYGYELANRHSYDQNYVYTMSEYNDLGAILREEIDPHYYEITVFPDYVAPPFNETAEANAAAVHRAMQSLFPGEEVTISYGNDDHTRASIETSSGVGCSVQCNDDGEITQIWISSPTAPKHWADKFKEMYQNLITLPELGLSEAEIASMPSSLKSTEEHFESGNQRITGFIAPDPMTCEWLNLVFYIHEK